MEWLVEVPGGAVPVLADDEGSERWVVLAHGAGGHLGQTTVLWLADRIRASGAKVVRFNFLYRALGRAMPDRMPLLVNTYRLVVDSVRQRLDPKTLVIGGHSMGGRTASILESEGRHADGLLLFGYPLHPAGQPTKLRDAHIPNVFTPTLQLNGTEDQLCTKELMERVRLPAEWTLHWLEGADHSYSVSRASGRTKAQVAEEVEHVVRRWLASL